MTQLDPLDAMSPEEAEVIADSFASDEDLPPRKKANGKREPEREREDDDARFFAPIMEWHDDVTLGEVLDEVVRLLNRFVILRPAQARVVALWIAHSFTVGASDCTPYLHVFSPTKECGKSTLLELIYHIAYRALLAGSATPAALRRLVNKLEPAILLDELDALLKGDNAEVYRGLLNNGYKRGMPHYSCEGDKNDVVEYQVFCPKVLAGIHASTLPDTVQSRSICVSLERATPEQLKTLERMRGHTIEEICGPIRSKFARWASETDNFRTLQDADPNTDGLSGREADIWRPLFAIADLAGERWASLARSDALALKAAKGDDGDVGVQALEDIREVF